MKTRHSAALKLDTATWKAVARGLLAGSGYLLKSKQNQNVLASSASEQLKSVLKRGRLDC